MAIMNDYYVTVCDSCLTASCWHGVHMCDSSYEAGTIDLRASSLKEMGRENEDNYSREKLLEICGAVEEAKT